MKRPSCASLFFGYPRAFGRPLRWSLSRCGAHAPRWNVSCARVPPMELARAPRTVGRAWGPRHFLNWFLEDCAFARDYTPVLYVENVHERIC